MEKISKTIEVNQIMSRDSFPWQDLPVICEMNTVCSRSFAQFLWCKHYI